MGLLLALGLVLALGLGRAAAAGTPLPAYFVQVGCLDAAGAMLPGRLPFEPGCDRTRPVAAGDPLPYRKHDWPGTADAAALPRGYQASDSVLGSLLGRPAAIQTFDFGDKPRRFGQHDAGDGGQVIPLRPGAEVLAAMTEDGGGGVQWFQSPACRQAMPAPGWLFAAPPLSAGWRQRLVRLNITAGPGECPTRFNRSLTRWRRATIALPWREAVDGRTASTPADTLVSEHFGGASIAAADHLERFWFARGLGLVRWERWENIPRSRRPGLAAMIRIMRHSGRCPPIALGEPPGPGWELADCRSWTNLVRATPGQPLAGLDWPPAALR